jgi:hypothetical protein
MEITHEQLINITHSTLIDVLKSDADKKTILTNNPRIATILSDLCKKQGCTKLSNIYFVTEDRDWATGLYTNFGGKNDDFLLIGNTYVAPINEFAKEFRRKFDYILLDFDGLSSKGLTMACEAINHGAKDDCTITITSPCESTDEIITNKINLVIENISKSFCSDLPEIQRFNIYMNTVSIPSSVVSWVTVPEPIKLTDELKKFLEIPTNLRPPVEDGETPFFGTKNHAAFVFLLRFISEICVNARSFLIPECLFFIDDGKFSTGIGYTAKVYRDLPSISHKIYRSKCHAKVEDNIPRCCIMSNNSMPIRIRDIITKMSDEKKILSALPASKLKKISIIAWCKRILIENNISLERSEEIAEEINTWAHGKGGLVDKIEIIKKLNEYPEFFNSDKLAESTKDES